MSAAGEGPAPPVIRCPQCGTSNGRDARFCGVCGAATTSTEPASIPGRGVATAATGSASNPGPGPGPGPAPVLIGREIAGRYRVLAKLGEGGMGAVFRAEQISLKRTVAVKLLRPDVSADPMVLRRFNAEAEVVAKLSHPGTVNIYDFGQDTDGTLFIAMELIDGRSLRQVIQREAPLPLPRTLAIATQIAASLADAHAHGIVHRDLKPDNVMLCDRGRERDVVRVLDFGIAKLRDDTRATQAAMTQLGDMLGTPQYMAPEQIRGEAIDGRTDIYALGCLLYEMVTGRLPHDAATVLAMLSKHLLEAPVPPSQRRPDLGLPPAIDRLILGAMAKDPKARPPAMEGFGEQLAALLRSLPGDPRSAGPAAAPQVSRPGPAPVPGPPMRADVPVPRVAYPPAPPVAPPQAPIPQRMPVAPVGYAPPMPQPAPRMYPPGVASWPGAPGHAAPRPRPLGLILAIGGAAVVGVTIAAVVVAGRADTQGASDSTVLSDTPADEPRGPDAELAEQPPSPDPPSEPAPAPAPVPAPAPPPRAPAHPAHPDVALADGKRIPIGQGVSLVVPPGFQFATKDGGTFVHDDRGVFILAFPITEPTSDAQELARSYARATGLSWEGTSTVVVGGVQRPAPVFQGKLQGVDMIAVGVALLGKDYRVAVILHVPVQRGNERAVKELVAELWPRRIVLP